MPLFKGKSSKSKPGKAIAYITNPNKAAIVSSHALDDNRDYAGQFTETARLYGKGDGFNERKYYHFKFSCDPVDGVTPEQSHKMAEEMVSRCFPGYECVIATHTDKPHCHSHIVVNAVSFESGMKLHLNNAEYAALKDLANQIAQERGFTPLDFRKSGRDKMTSQEKQIILHGGSSWKEELKNVITEAKNQCGSFIEFRNHLEKYGVTIQRNTEKTISFKHPEKERTIRGERLGADYTKGAVMNALDQQRDRGASGREEPAVCSSAGHEGASTRYDQSIPIGIREQPPQKDIDRISGAIREIEGRASLFSPAGRAEVSAERRAARTAEALDREADGDADGLQRAAELQYRKRSKQLDLER